MPDQDTQRYVARSGFRFTSTIWESSVSKLLEQRADGLVSDPETDEAP